VRVLNDVQAALVAECWLGAARDCDNVLMLTLGTGVGGAIRCDGKLLRGCIGRAGHVGHLCLDPDGRPGITRIPGPLEDAIGRRTTGRFLSTFELVKAARSGDEYAQAAWDRSVRALACGIASLINIVDPEVVLIGGGIAEAGEALFDPLAAHLDEIEWRPGGHQVEIRRPTFAEWAGAHGAAHHAASAYTLI
jgi:glucokinase